MRSICNSKKKKDYIIAIFFILLVPLGAIASLFIYAELCGSIYLLISNKYFSYSTPKELGFNKNTIKHITPTFYILFSLKHKKMDTFFTCG